MTLPFVGAFLALSLWELILGATLVSKVVLGCLIVASLASWAVIFRKWGVFRAAKRQNLQFLRAFRKATNLETVSLAVEQFRAAPLTGVFEFGFQEVRRQMTVKGNLANPGALERTLELGISEELTRLERHMNWLATTATVSPFIGLFGTVLGIIDAFQGLGAARGSSLAAVAPGIADALIATAMGLAAAIPAAIFFNHYGNVIKEMGARMDDFSLEFMNLAERNHGIG